MNEDTLYRINLAMGFTLTLSLTGLFVLMLVLWPRTRLNKLALWFMFSCCAVMWRWCVAVLRPDLLSIRESIVATIVFAMATVSTLWFMVAAWWEHVREARK